MGVEQFEVLFAIQDAGLGLSGLKKEVTKTEAEELKLGFTEKLIFKGPVEAMKKVIIEAETAGQAAKAAVKVLGGPGLRQGEKIITVKKANWEENTVT